MINSHYSLKISDIAKYKAMKDSAMYRSYVQDIVHSPLFSAITKEHVNDIDVTPEITKLQNDVKLTPTELNKIFKSAIAKMAVTMVADALIMKEIVDVGLDDAKEDLDANFMHTYLLGLAEDKYYKRAEKLLQENPDTNSVLYRGYLEWMKRNTNNVESVQLDEKKKPKSPKPSKKSDSIKIDLDVSELKI